MTYFYIQTNTGDIYGSFDTRSEALRYVDYSGLEEGWKLIDSEPRDADVEHDGNSNHTHLD